MKTIIYSKQALKFLTKINRAEAEKIVQKIDQYASNPSELKNQVKKLRGVPFYRLRIGDYRVVFDENGIILNIIKIDNRGNVYKEL
ncbi:MAG: type II toxin-antitoxin system RelE/ParE family toxin [Alphaproteobacteria bacterium]|nr:type II toxin-antitoxin system RelE/ParE family toxin [Alphaproteobacteria bacterium]